jgi:uncharacterized protein
LRCGRVAEVLRVAQDDRIESWWKSGRCYRHDRDWEFVITIKQSAEGVTFAVRVHPRAKKDAITGELGDALKVALTAPPVEGKANDACIAFFAKLLKVPRSSVSIAAGLTSRNKVVRVTALSAEEVRARLG